MAVFDNFDLNNVLESFADIGGFNIVLPFLLIFAVTFAILQKIKLFGEEDKSKRVNGIVSFVLALFLIAQQELVDIMLQFLPRVSMIVLVFLMLLLVVGVFKRDAVWSEWLLGLGVIAAIASVLWAIGASAGWDVPLLNNFTEAEGENAILLYHQNDFLRLLFQLCKSCRHPLRKVSDDNKDGEYEFLQRPRPA